MKVLFVSGLDFKEKSIQVIRETPEAYVRNGIEVHYVVFRDTSKSENYYYEDEINPDGVNIYRFYTPLTNIRNKVKNRLILSLLNKVSRYWSIVKLAITANKVLKENEIDVCYGYERDGVLAANLLKLFGRLKNTKLISRFQGTFYITDIIRHKKYIKGLINWDSFLALYLPSDLCIMTNDGTQGDKILKKINSKNLNNLKFWPNGVNEQKIDEKRIEEIRSSINPENKTIILSVSRLVKVKRVDRGIEVVNKLVNEYGFNNFKYFIVGEGGEKEYLQSLVREYGIQEYVYFVGAVKNQEVKDYLNISDIFLSTFDVSNVGNPLLEAIRANKIIITLNNGDTGDWIKHEKNGFIFDIDDHTIDNISKCILSLVNNSQERNEVLNNIKITEKEKLWTWEERLDTEVKVVKQLTSLDI